MTETPFLRVPGVRCEVCNSAELRVIIPGCDGASCDLFALTRPVADRGFCCIDHAKKAGVFPWCEAA